MTDNRDDFIRVTTKESDGRETAPTKHPFQPVPLLLLPVLSNQLLFCYCRLLHQRSIRIRSISTAMSSRVPRHMPQKLVSKPEKTKICKGRKNKNIIWREKRTKEEISHRQDAHTTLMKTSLLSTQTYASWVSSPLFSLFCPFPPFPLRSPNRDILLRPPLPGDATPKLVGSRPDKPIWGGPIC